MTAGGIRGCRVHLSGSASAAAADALVCQAHELVQVLVPRILEMGGGIVVGAGKEPRGREGGPALIFDWTALEAAMAALASCANAWPSPESSIVVVTSERSASEIPEDRKPLWESLLRSGHVRHERILPGARSGALLRDRQAAFGDVLLTIGGGTGVEHLAGLYLDRCRPVIPLDLPLGASREDGLGGSERLVRQALACPSEFIEVAAGVDPGAMLALTSSDNGRRQTRDIAENLARVLENLNVRKAFFVRLMNREHEEFASVDHFFRNVVDPVVAEANYQRVDLSADQGREAFLNVEVFKSLHYASLAVVDLTGLRPNCLAELGYALGRPLPTLVTCKRGTVVPFDPSALSRYEWEETKDDTQRREEFRLFWGQNVGRLPPVHRRS
jgi:hypothetical protein